MKKKFPRGGIRKNAQEFIDADYLDKLSPAEREWYDNFVQAEYTASHIAAKKIGMKLDKEEKKRLNAQNNRRARDAYNKLDRSIRAEKAIANLEDEKEEN